MTPLSSPASALLVTGVGSVVLGGLVAAVTDPLMLEHGSWAAAYLVLVTGVGQVAMGHRREHVPADRALRRSGWWQWAFWNLGGIAVILGTLFARWLVDLGTAMVLVALVLAIRAARAEPTPSRPEARRWALLYRLILVILAVGAPVGVVLSHLRHP